MPIKNSSDTIGNQTRDLSACSAVPQPTAPPRSPRQSNENLKKITSRFIAGRFGTALSKNHNTFVKPKFNIVLHKVCPKRSVRGVFRACAKPRKRLRQERLYDGCHWNRSTTYSMYITSAGLQCHYFIWQISFVTSRRSSAASVGGRLSALGSYDEKAWTDKWHMSHKMRDLQQMQPIRRTDPHVTTGDRQYLNLPVTECSLSMLACTTWP